MGYTSNQWLNRGQGMRSRSYMPIGVDISCKKDTDISGDGLVAEFKARRRSGEYQTLALSVKEIDDAAPTIIELMSAKAREKLLVDNLRRLSHAKFLRLLALDLRRRVRLGRDR